MQKIIMFIIVGLIFVSPLLLYADGQYSIERDRGGVYMETERDGSWYIDRDDVTDFRVGQKGTYTKGSDGSGTYILIGKGRKYYIDKRAQEQLQSKLEDFNKRQAQNLEMQTKVLLEGGRVLVPVMLRYGGNEIKVLLLLDTGASMIVLHREVADQLNMKGIRKGRLMLAGGEVINADLEKLDSVKAGPISRKNITASIIDYKGPSTRYQGLLGMNFLNDLVYRIDLKKQTITWENGLGIQ
jgi:clan AA aspartic protease (TIGR02281 family)